ncbi:homoserine kinase [Aureibacter tunicatorum]|uniref:Homoserine kinase n=1 Tax=Aureibacter tunicatorum TaxID=866807 RepID=A0AAE3XIC1_9BACT|nr:homoserine kinase [Aureibacter tunicatorum]MDR6237347.1 homoserine kinase [Aureibacter tunicatorum]BDD06338.1 homoserine kinase [Aureibacter tunicatorum]
MEKIKVFAPATVANVTCGFDVLGFAVNAPGDIIELQKADHNEVRILSITGDNGRLPKDAEKNTASVVIKAFLEAIGSKQGIDIHLEKQMPLGSGMGSSAASSAAAAFAINKLMGEPMSMKEALPFAMEGERIACGAAHADNVAPALLGGFVLIRSYDPLDVIKIKTPEHLYSTIVHPHIEVNTKDARNILRGQVPLDKAVKQWGNVGGLIAGLLQSDYEMISNSMEDTIIEPIRSILIPGYDVAKAAALKNNALGFGISGSGPSMFTLSQNEKTAKKIGESMRDAYKQLGIGSDVYTSKVNDEGPIILYSE